jgi:hypothetical protein
MYVSYPNLNRYLSYLFYRTEALGGGGEINSAGDFTNINLKKETVGCKKSVPHIIIGVGTVSK